jgi:arylesterase / paraoxonase
MATSLKRRLGVLAGLLAVVLLSYWLSLFVLVTGWTEAMPANPPQNCAKLPGIIGPEDLVIDWRTNRAYVSSTNRRTTDPNGAIYLIDLTQAPLRPIRLQGLPAKSFSPHGLDLWREGDQARLFVVNHGADGRQHSIELFDVAADGTLAHSGTVRGEALRSPNDVAAAGFERFYASNDPAGGPWWRTFAETYLLWPGGNVVYWDGARVRAVAGGFKFANGVALSRDGGLVLVAETLGRSVAFFERDPFTGALRAAGKQSFPFAVDNISVGLDDRFIVTGHPRPLAFTAHSQNAAASPSMVMKSERALPAPSLSLAPDDLKLRPPGLLYADDGRQYSGASVAAEDGQGRLFIGQVFGDGLLVCTP